MEKDATRLVDAFRWEQQRPEEPEERDIAVDPFSLRQLSRVDIDRPLPIPSVSVADRHSSPARFGGGGAPTTSSAALSPRVSIAGRLNALAEVTGWDNDVRSASPVHQAPPSAALPTAKCSAGGGEEAELSADSGFDVILSSSERKASEPQRWGSDVPLIAAADAEEGYSFGNARGRNGPGKAKHAGDAPFKCCMYVPGLSRRGRTPAAAAAAARSSSGAFVCSAAAAATVEVERYPDDPGSARPSTMSLAVSLERFDCGSLSTSSWGDLDLDAEASSSSYFDLPLELILSCDDGDGDADLPVCAAFVFDSDGVRKSVLKKRLAAGAAPRLSLGKALADASGRISAHHDRVSLKSRPPSTSS